MSRILWIALIFSCPLLASAADELIGVRGRLWFDELKGDVRSSTSSLTGTKLDVASDLGIQRGEGPAKEVDLWVQPPLIPFRFGASAWSTEFKSDSTLDATISFGGQSFSAGTPVKTDITFDSIGITAEYYLSLPVILGNTTQVGLQTGLDYYHLTAELSNAALSDKESTQAVLWKVGLRAMQEIMGIVEIEANVSGFYASGFAGIRISYVDASIEVRGKIAGHFFAGLGYRALHFNGDDEHRADVSNHLQVDIRGIFICAGVVW